MRKKDNFVIDLVIYPFEVMVSFGQTDKELEKDLNKVGLDWDDKCKIIGMGKYVMFPNNTSLIRLFNYPEYHSDYGVLQHEIFHCVTFIMDKIGIELSLYKSDEAYAYLIGYLTEEIYKKIK